MSEKISQYSTSVSALATGDLMDVSKLISTSPDVYQSQKLNYSVLLTELNNDLSFVDGTGTTNYSARFSASGTIADGIIQDNGTTAGIGSLDAATALNIATSLAQGIKATQSKSNGNSEGIYGINIVANTGRNIGIQGESGNSSTASIGVRGVYATTGVTNVSTSSYITNGNGAAGFFQSGRSGSGTIYGVIATTDLFTPDAAVTGIAGYFKAGGGGSNYAIQLVDGTEGAGKYLQSDASGRASWVNLSVSNLGNANLTSSDDARTFTLKTGTTTTQNLAILTGAGGNLTKWMGNGQIDMGSTSYYVNPKIYLDPTLNDNFIIYSGSSGFCYYQAQNRNYFLYGTTTGVIQLAAQSGTITAKGDDGGFRAVNASGTFVATLEVEGSGSWFFLANSAGTKKVELYPGGNQYYFLDGCSFGYAAGGAPLAVVDGKGKGSTSATLTASFQNSSAVTSLKVRDDNYVIQRAINSAINSGDLGNNEMSFYIDEAGNTLTVKVKYSSGTVKTGTVALV